MWAPKLHMRIVLYKALKAKISIIWKIPNLRIFPTVYNALGDPKLYSRSSRHYSSSEDEFHFSRVSIRIIRGTPQNRIPEGLF